MSVRNNMTDASSILNEVFEKLQYRPKVDWRQLSKKVFDEMIAKESKKHTTEIINEYRNVGSAKFSFSLFEILKKLGKIDKDRTRLIESIPAYAPCPETNMYYYVTTDGCIVNSRTLQVTELDDSFWEYLEVFQQEL